MTERERRLLVSRALDVGERMLLCGGEVSRVEDTISRILKSYGALRVEVLTENRRVSIVAYSNDFSRLEQLNALSREVCAARPDLSVIGERLAAIDLPPRKKLPITPRNAYWSHWQVFGPEWFCRIPAAPRE